MDIGFTAYPLLNLIIFWLVGGFFFASGGWLWGVLIGAVRRGP